MSPWRRSMPRSAALFLMVALIVLLVLTIILLVLAFVLLVVAFVAVAIFLVAQRLLAVGARPFVLALPFREGPLLLRMLLMGVAPEIEACPFAFPFPVERLLTLAIGFAIGQDLSLGLLALIFALGVVGIGMQTDGDAWCDLDPRG